MQRFKQAILNVACLTVLSVSAFAVFAGEDVKKDTVSGEAVHSGFLSDYSRLKESKDTKGNEIMRWVDPSIKTHHYQKFYVPDVVLYPEPRPSKQVSGATLEDIRRFVQSTLRERLAARSLLADAAGPDVLQLNIAITAVDVSAAGLKPWELLPIGLVRAGVQVASGRRNRDVKLFVEAEALDSQSKQVMVQSVREGTGAQLKSEKAQLTLEQFKTKINHWADAVMADIDALPK